MELVERTICFLELPLPEDVIILRPELVVIKFGSIDSIDVGALCYVIRQSRAIRRRRGKARPVVLTSFSEERANHVRIFLRYISDVCKFSAKRYLSLRNMVSRFVRYVDWVEDNGYKNGMQRGEDSVAPVAAYLADLRERSLKREITQNSAARMQLETLEVLREYVGIEDLGKGINLLHVSPHLTSSASPPDEVAQGRILELCSCIFSGLSDLILDRKIYPFPVPMPKYLEIPSGIMWIFPTKVWCCPRGFNDREKSQPYGYNYVEGRLATKEEVLNTKKYKMQTEFAAKKTVGQMMRYSRLTIEDANSNWNHNHRRQMGMIAMTAFLILFLSRTGMNWQQIIELEWPEDAAVESGKRPRFRCIKFRAKNRLVSYQLPLGFVPVFNRFLDLRKFLLKNNVKFPYMFFTLGEMREKQPMPLKSALSVMLQPFRRIDPSLILILTRAWRAAKSDWLITRTDPAITAMVLQNTERTVMRSYATGSAERHALELSAFLERVIVRTQMSASKRTAGAIGQCIEFGSAEPVDDGMTIVSPDCKRPDTGCLYCMHFRVHADETDVRKLLSCRYCLAQSTGLAGLYQVSEQLIDRIDEVLRQIAVHDEKLVRRLTTEVEEGELDPYWATKFDMLQRLGVVNGFV